MDHRDLKYRKEMIKIGTKSLELEEAEKKFKEIRDQWGIDIYFDSQIYPRSKVHKDTIDNYEEMLTAGQDMPPITLDPEGRVIDGVHRILAAKRVGEKQVKKLLQQAKPVDDKFFWRAVKRNHAHGLPLSRDERKAAATRLLEEEYDKQEIADLFGVSTRTIYKWTKEFREQKQRRENEKIKELRDQGRSVREIAEFMDIPKSTVQERLSKLRTPAKTGRRSHPPKEEPAHKSNLVEWLESDAEGLLPSYITHKMGDENQLITLQLESEEGEVLEDFSLTFRKGSKDRQFSLGDLKQALDELGREIEKPIIQVIYQKQKDNAKYYLKELRALSNKKPGRLAVRLFAYGLRASFQRVRPCLRELYKQTDCQLEKILKMNQEELAEIFKYAGQQKVFAKQLLKFCQQIQERFGSWEKFLEFTKEETIPSLEEVVGSLKRALAFKIFAAGIDRYVLPDRHMLKALGIKERITDLDKYKSQVLPRTRQLVETIPDPEVSPALLFLAIWIDKTGISQPKVKRDN